MTDLTVLISPLPLYPAMKPGFIFGRRTPQPVNRPIMVTLETEREPDGEDGTSGSDDQPSMSSPPRRTRSPRRYDSALLSPPPQTWKSRPRPRHRPSRSQSAPPERRIRKDEVVVVDVLEEQPIELAPLDFVRPKPPRSLTSFPAIPTMRGGELIRPPPPLLRPTTFWRKTRKSGVSGPSYSPSSHLIRRSTFIAAGLTFDSPVHDLSALCVESRKKGMLTRILFVVGILAGWGVPLAASSRDIKTLGVQDVSNSRRQVVIPQPAVSASPTSPLVVVSPVPTPVITLTPSPTPLSSLPTNSPIVEITIVITAPSVRTSATPFASSSISAFPLPIPPANNTNQQTGSAAQPESRRKFTLLYLIPVFVILGILWGALAAWLTYKWLMRRRKAQDNVFVCGPRYVPAASDLEGGKSPQQYEMHVVALHWPDIKEAGKESEMHEEHDPFFLPPSPTAQRAGRTKSAQSTTTAYSDTTCALETDDESRRDDVPWESLRHKSIKRGILAEVQKEGSRIDTLRPSGTVRNTGTGVRKKTVSRRVSRHRRTGSDHLIDDIDQMLNGADAHGIPSSRPPNLRADSVMTTLSLVSTTTAGDKTQWKPGRGFRIVEESPLSSRGPTPVPSEDSADVRGQYTTALARHDTSRSTSPLKGVTSPPIHARHHADVLPQSPPQITSPLLENNLCFTPHRPPRAFISPLTTPTNAKRPDTSRKLRSPKQPQLPIPRYADGGINSPRPDKYRGRTAKASYSKQQRPPMNSKSSSASSAASTYTRNGDGRAVQALRKVGDIVERSWGARDLGDEGVRALSPTGFGRRTGN